MITIMLIALIALLPSIGIFVACHFIKGIPSFFSALTCAMVAYVVILGGLSAVSSQKTSNTKSQVTELKLNDVGHTIYSVKNTNNDDDDGSNTIYTFTSEDGKTISVQTNKADVNLNYNKSNKSKIVTSQKVRYLSFLGFKSKLSSIDTVTVDIIK